MSAIIKESIDSITAVYGRTGSDVSADDYREVVLPGPYHGILNRIFLPLFFFQLHETVHGFHRGGGKRSSHSEH